MQFHEVRMNDHAERLLRLADGELYVVPGSHGGLDQGNPHAVLRLATRQQIDAFAAEQEDTVQTETVVPIARFQPTYIALRVGVFTFVPYRRVALVEAA